MSDFDERPARLVVDTSAIAGFVASSIAVGELLAEIDAEGGSVLIPYPCLIEAAAGVVDGGAPFIGALLQHPATMLVYGVDVDNWPMMAGVRAIVGAYEPAAAAWVAVTAGVDVLTRYPALYTGLGDDIALPFTD